MEMNYNIYNHLEIDFLSNYESDVAEEYIYQLSLWSDGYDEKYLKGLHRGGFSEECVICVDKNSNIVVCYAIIEVFEDYIHINDFMTNDTYRRIGYGGQVIEFLFSVDYIEEQLYNEGEYPNYCSLEVDCVNKTAIMFYLKHDFIPCGLMSGYYKHDKGNTDALFMKRVIPWEGRDL